MNSKSLAKAGAAASAVFIVLCLVSIDDSQISMFRSRQDFELMRLERPTISRENLRDSEALLGQRLALEHPGIPQDAITSLPAWAEWRSTITAYDARLKLREEQSRELDRRLQRRSLWTSWTALAVIVASVIFRTLSRRQEGDSRNLSASRSQS
jgi:hypothetical protein